MQRVEQNVKILAIKIRREGDLRWELWCESAHTRLIEGAYRDLMLSGEFAAIKLVSLDDATGREYEVLKFFEK